MKVIIERLQNEQAVEHEEYLIPLKLKEEYDFEVVGRVVHYIGCYDIERFDKRKMTGEYPCAYAVDKEGNKYMIFVERKKYQMFAD